MYTEIDIANFIKFSLYYNALIHEVTPREFNKLLLLSLLLFYYSSADRCPYLMVSIIVKCSLITVPAYI